VLQDQSRRQLRLCHACHESAEESSEPIHYQRTWLLGRPGQPVQEYSCAEDNVDAPHLQPGPGPIGPDGQRGYEKMAQLPPPPDKDHPAKTSIPD
jgi:hypothetical protein